MSANAIGLMTKSLKIEIYRLFFWSHRIQKKNFNLALKIKKPQTIANSSKLRFNALNHFKIDLEMFKYSPCLAL